MDTSRSYLPSKALCQLPHTLWLWALQHLCLSRLRNLRLIRKEPVSVHSMSQWPSWSVIKAWAQNPVWTLGWLLLNRLSEDTMWADLEEMRPGTWLEQVLEKWAQLWHWLEESSQKIRQQQVTSGVCWPPAVQEPLTKKPVAQHAAGCWQWLGVRPHPQSSWDLGGNWVQNSASGRLRTLAILGAPPPRVSPPQSLGSQATRA